MSFAVSVVTNLYTTILVGIRTWCVLNPRRARSVLIEAVCQAILAHHTQQQAIPAIV
jgi:hypothetical protein